MMKEQFLRTQALIGEDALEKLSRCRVAVFGIGGVGSYAVEALSRSGIGELDLIDNDTVNVTNINRQLIATHDTLNMYKTDVAKERVMQINPDARVNVFRTFYLPENSSEFDFKKYDYVIDAVDTVTAKIEIIVNAKRARVPVISSMGTGNKLDPTRFEVEDIYNTSVCPLAKVMRHELKKRNIESLKVVYSKEEPIKQIVKDEGIKRNTPASIAFVPSVAGLILAGEVIKDLIK